MTDDLKTILEEASNKYQRILQQTHNEALLRNEIQTKRWLSYKSEHEELSGRLLSMRDKLSHTIMVPLGKKALMRGNLVHTNEILVCLGDGWFVKQTAQEAVGVCNRRIQRKFQDAVIRLGFSTYVNHINKTDCNEVLEKLRKEEELLNSRRSFTFKSDAFGGDQTQEVIEPYDEEAEKQWRERHRQKEKEYRQKLAQLRKSQTDKIETEEDIWRRLDALDVQEELEDELNRMNEDSEEDVESEDDSDSSSGEESNASLVERVDVSSNSKLKRRVSFKEEKEESFTCEEQIEDEDTVHIRFKHSDCSFSVPSMSEKEITSPADIYSHYMKHKVPKSILKHSSSIEQIVPVCEEVPRPLPVQPAIKAVGEEVVERSSSVPAVVTSERPVSRFKAAREASKR